MHIFIISENTDVHDEIGVSEINYLRCTDF